MQRAPRSAALWLAPAALVLCAAPVARGQVSPGPLARPHAQIDSVDRCTSCHVLGKGVRDDRCLACHKALAARIRSGTGYHPRATKNGKIACKTCHLDHAGRDFQLIEWPGKERDAFAHGPEADFELRGAHQKTRCKQCHAPRFIRDDLVRVQKTAAKAIGRTYLGLDRRCASCHDDPHRGEVGVDCQSCHSEDAFKPAHGFDHQKAKLPLRGKHRTVACEKCHLREDAPATAKGVERLRWRGLAYDACIACHQDRHAGRLGPDCEACHSNDGFKPSRYEAADHQKTGFALSGRHAKTECATCHGERLDRVVKGASCASCHQDTYHRGSVGTDCAACHTDGGWERPTYTRAKHAPERFALAGRHAKATCERCHATLAAGGEVESLPPDKAPAGGTASGPAASDRPIPGTRAGAQPGAVHAPQLPLTQAATSIAFARATRPPIACAQCHRGGHDRRLGASCQECHQPTGWKAEARFTADDHQKTRYPLRGRHRSLDCTECHQKAASGGLERLAPIDHDRCQACHEDAHQGELAKRPDKGRCESCHTVEGFKPARFERRDHRRLRFRLEGKHAAVDCAKCHRPTGKKLTLKPVFSECKSCHPDPHEGQLGRSATHRGCASCHDPQSWKPKGFDHEKTRFKLRGKHRKAACVRCHVVVASRRGYDVRLYKPLSRGCTGCHQDPHLGQFRAGTPVRGCQACHTQQRFRPADRFDHQRMSGFPLDGKHAGAACVACHDRIALGGGLFTVRYRATPAECRACHADEHKGARWRR